MSKKEDGEAEERTMLAGKIHHGKKKASYQRRQWLEKRRRRKRRKRSNIIDQNQKHRKVGNGGRHRSTVRLMPTSILPPLSWSSKSLICHLQSEHHSKRTCLHRQWFWSNTNSNSILLDNNQQILFHPRTSSSTEVILSDRPLPFTGKHYWEIYMPAIYGTSIMFGIATQKQQLISSSFTDLIGIDQHGWGLSHHGLVWHNGIARRYLSQPMDTLQPILIALEFDGDARTLSYTINNQAMGIAFHSIPKDRSIYPAVSSTSAQSTMILKHRCKICSSLRELCLKLIKSSELRDEMCKPLLPRHLFEQLMDRRLLLFPSYGRGRECAMLNRCTKKLTEF